MRDPLSPIPAASDGASASAKVVANTAPGGGGEPGNILHDLAPAPRERDLHFASACVVAGIIIILVGVIL